VLVLSWFLLLAVPYAVIHELAPDAEDGAWGLVSFGLMLAILTPAAMLTARMMGRPAGSMSSVVGRIRWRWLATCVGVFLLSYAVAVGASFVIEVIAPTPDVPGARVEAWPGAATFFPQLALILVIVPFQAAGEEYAFRGTILQALGGWFRSPWIGIVITSVGFAAMHAPTEWVVWLALIATGGVTAWMTVRTGGLEAAIAQHAINNVVGFAADAATGGFGSWAADLNTDVPIVHTLITVAIMIITSAIIVRLAGRKTIANVVPDPPPA
jgi:membrane protease YdiL (CAAX protease family)